MCGRGGASPLSQEVGCSGLLGTVSYPHLPPASQQKAQGSHRCPKLTCSSVGTRWGHSFQALPQTSCARCGQGRQVPVAAVTFQPQARAPDLPSCQPPLPSRGHCRGLGNGRAREERPPRNSARAVPGGAPGSATVSPLPFLSATGAQQACTPSSYQHSGTREMPAASSPITPNVSHAERHSHQTWITPNISHTERQSH